MYTVLGQSLQCICKYITSSKLQCFLKVNLLDVFKVYTTNVLLFHIPEEILFHNEARNISAVKVHHHCAAIYHSLSSYVQE